VRIRVWTAFASNNSGSYTIVGSFDKPERAEEVAREIDEVIEAHTAWHLQHPWDPSDESPLAVFAKARGLDAPASLGAGDEWPNHGDAPSVIAVGHQVVVHAPYTVTLPKTFGALFYARGGAVETMLDHAHDALVVHVEAWWHWNHEETDEVRSARAAALEAVVMAPASPVHAHAKQLVCARGRDWIDAPLVIGAVFSDLVAGVAAVVEVVKQHATGHRLRIVEALDRADPLSHLREAPP